MKVRTFMPLVAAALIAVLVLAVGAGTGAAQSDVQAAPAKYKVTLVTDIGGLDDRSFNFLANKGLQDAKKKLGIDGSVFISKSDRDYIPNLTRAARNGSGLVIGVGFLMADAVARVAKRFPKTKFAIVDNSGVSKELKGAPTNVRGLLFKEQEAGYLVGYLAGRQILSKPYNGQTKLGAVGGLKIPPVDRFIAGYYAGAKKAGARVEVTPSYSQDFVDQATCKEQALNQIANGAGVVFQVAGQCGLGVLSAAKEKGVFGIGVDADQGYLGAHVMTSATKKVDVAVYKTIEAAKKSGAKFRTNFNAIFTVANGGVGYGKISGRIAPALKTAVENIRKQIAAGKIKGIPQAPPATTG
ncbi:MAG: BMP family ABC transporter substrate-binding protein [Thermoleophilia bacterium]|nr:BMP family ABC transporter substrate-binding protein [Thermoleophilia bacterium]